MEKGGMKELLADVREQVLYLQELGVELMDAEVPEFEGDQRISASMGLPTASTVPVNIEPPTEYTLPPKIKIEAQPKRAPGARLSALPSLRSRSPIIKDMPLRSAARMPIEEAKPVLAEPEPIVVSALSETTDSIESIRAEIGDCTRCKLHVERKQIVHTTGNFKAELMFVGEAPGRDEDEQGFPFVGRAGQLLTKIIESVGMKREDVCIGNINRCRPPGNRQPEPDETAMCRPFILREMSVVKPKVVVVLGATAAHNLLQVKTPISKLRGNFHDYFGVKVMPTFHPAYLLRDPHKKRDVWDDMKKVRDFLVSGG
ncbi:hypothetical protein BH24ACI3_BH24ACI3_05980 [soil metagenome]